MSRTAAPAVLLACLLVAPPSASAAQDATPSPDPVAAAAHATVAIGSIGFDIDIVVEGRGQRMVTHATGAAELGQDGRGWMRWELPIAGLAPVEAIVDGRFVYVRGGYWDEGLEEGDWFGVDLDSTDPATEAFRKELSDTDDAPLILYWLLGGTEPPRHLGDESLDGVSVAHYALPVDLGTAARAAPRELRQLFDDNIYQFRTRGLEPVFDTDVWIDESGLVRRMEHAFVYRPVDIDDFRFSWDLHDLGRPVEQDLPDPADVLLVGDSKLPGPAEDPLAA